jgi:hypothetical protein
MYPFWRVHKYVVLFFISVSSYLGLLLQPLDNLEINQSVLLNFAVHYTTQRHVPHYLPLYLSISILIFISPFICIFIRYLQGNLHCLLALGEYEELEGSALALKSHLKSAEQIDEYASWMAEVQKLGTLRTHSTVHDYTSDHYLNIVIVITPLTCVYVEAIL